MKSNAMLLVLLLGLVLGQVSCDDAQFSPSSDCGEMTCVAGRRDAGPIFGTDSQYCTPESDLALCERLGLNCDTVVTRDNCGADRTVHCGLCQRPQTCGGTGSPGRCGCVGSMCSFVTVQGNHFAVDGSPWYPYGIFYVPLYEVPYVLNTGHWLWPGIYDPVAIEEDLSFIEGLGMNALAIQAPFHSEAWPNLAAFLDRCRAHSLRVAIWMPADPLARSYDLSIAEGLLGSPELDLPNRPEVFAYEPAWEPYLGRERDRAQWNGVFSHWIAGTFGSVPNATNALGFPVRQSADGLQAAFMSHTVPVRAPPSQDLTIDFVVRNVGTETWPAKSTIMLGQPNLWPADWGNLLKPLPDGVSPSEEVPPGGETTITYRLKQIGKTHPLPGPGRYAFGFQMFEASPTGGWFGEWLEAEIEVDSAASTPVVRTILRPTPVLGPTDEQLRDDGSWRTWVSGYRRALDAEISRRFARRVRWFHERAPRQLVSTRQGYGGNGTPWTAELYALDLASTAGHFDFVAPEGYELARDPTSCYDHPSSYVRSGAAVTTAYARWAGARPVLWLEYGLDARNNTEAAQRTFYENFIEAVIETGGDGAMAWWYPGGTRVDENSDYGIVDQYRAPRPVCDVLGALAKSATSPRAQPSLSVYEFDPIADARGYVGIYEAARGPALDAVNAGKRFVMQPVGTGTTSDTNPIAVLGSAWQVPRDLWADIHKVELRVGDQGSWFEVTNGRAYAVPASTRLYVRAEVKNLGPATWSPGSGVSFGANENFGAGFRSPITVSVARLDNLVVAEQTLTEGLSCDTDYQFQMVVEKRAWMDGLVRVRLIVY